MVSVLVCPRISEITGRGTSCSRRRLARLWRRIWERKERFMSEKRIITIRSGNEEVRMEVTEEEYQRYFRPWWRQKKREQRNREAMEEKGYTEESYEEWKENDMRDKLFAEDTEELAEKRMLLGVLKDALDDLLPEEREIAEKVFGEEMSVYEYAL